jgi:hypothetical protein
MFKVCALSRRRPTATRLGEMKRGGIYLGLIAHCENIALISLLLAFGLIICKLVEELKLSRSNETNIFSRNGFISGQLRLENI